jgi:DNA adenine methylase Dam
MEKYIKSPLNYVGGKYKLLDQIIPLFPNDIDTFVDLFAGGFNVGINVKAKKIICNDYEKVVIELLEELSKLKSDEALSILKETIKKYDLSKENEEGFKKIRSDYNNGDRRWNMFYAMLTHAFNYQIRFNNSNEYNMPFGKNRSSFNKNLEKNFIVFVNELNSKDVEFSNFDFLSFDFSNLKSNDIVYCDPPYLITCASYNEKNGWNEIKEKQLLDLLDRLNSEKINFALSNVFENKGKTNEILKEWSEKYNVHYLNNSYGNCNYHAKDKSKNGTVEVLITNY